MSEALRNVAVRKLIRALERDGFEPRRSRGSQRVYRHRDGRRVVIHYHHGGDTLPMGTLRQIIAATRWTDDDLRRLGLVED
jgi:predicted RNA binding protein YcfA (HicA-like mRNA interferase family)